MTVRKRVVITGMATITPLGDNLDDFYGFGARIHCGIDIASVGHHIISMLNPQIQRRAACPKPTRERIDIWNTRLPIVSRSSRRQKDSSNPSYDWWICICPAKIVSFQLNSDHSWFLLSDGLHILIPPINMFHGTGSSHFCWGAFFLSPLGITELGS